MTAEYHASRLSIGRTIWTGAMCLVIGSCFAVAFVRALGGH